MEPFDAEKYQRLMNGLEAVELRLSDVKSYSDFYRIDSEFFKKLYLEYHAEIKSKSNEILSKVLKKILHPTELERIYQNAGIKILLAQNVRSNVFDFTTTVYMNSSVKSILQANLLEYNDVVLTRSGANYGQVACYKYNEEYYACADVLVLKNPTLKGGYLATFLNTKIGRALLDRGAYGMAQPHIAPSYLKDFPIPRFNILEETVDKYVELAYLKLSKSKETYIQAQKLLLDELGLHNWQPSTQNTEVKSFKNSFAQSGRLDAEYYQPKYDDFFSILSNTSKKKGWPVINLGALSEPLKYGSSTPYEYQASGVPFLRIADLSNYEFDKAKLKYISSKDASIEQVSSKVKANDILISRSGTLGLTVPIPSELEGSVYGSYFIRVRPKSADTNPTFITLYMNSLAGQIQVEQVNTGGIQTNLTIPVIENFRIVLPDSGLQEKLVAMVDDSKAYRKQSEHLLSIAKQAVEIAIEQNEEAAMNFISKQQAH